MKRTIYAITFLILLFFGALTNTQAMAQPSPTQKVPQLVQALTDEGAHIQKWSLYARHKTLEATSADFYHKAKSLQRTFGTFHWSHIDESADHHLKLTGERNIPGTDVTENITLFAYPRKNGIETYLIYVLNGTSWDKKKWNKTSNMLNQRLGVLFHQNGKIFACATGIYNDTMDIVISKEVNAILSRFHAKVVEKDEEKTFESVSAYTNQWKDTIITNGRKMNFQVGLRTVKDGTTVTIGTPIITTEY